MSLGSTTTCSASLSSAASPELQSMSRDVCLKEQDLFRNRPGSDALGNGRERHVAWMCFNVSSRVIFQAGFLAVQTSNPEVQALAQQKTHNNVCRSPCPNKPGKLAECLIVWADGMWAVCKGHVLLTAITDTSYITLVFSPQQNFSWHAAGAQVPHNLSIT